MRPVPAGRQRGQCCTPYSRLQEEIDNVETIAVTANNTANNAANAANTAVNTANSAASDAADALAGLTDGSVTQIGTSNVGTDTKPIKLVGGVPTVVTNELVDTVTAQTITGTKKYTNQYIRTSTVKPQNNSSLLSTVYTPAIYVNQLRNPSGTDIEDTMAWLEKYDNSTAQGVQIGLRTINSNGNRGTTYRLSMIYDMSGTVAYVTAPYRTYDPANTNDVATIGTLDAYTPMVRTTGNQSISGTKSFVTIRPEYLFITGADTQRRVQLNRSDDDVTVAPVNNVPYPQYSWNDKNGVNVAAIYATHKTDNTTALTLVVRNADGTTKYITLGAGDP